jgi:hypothetical protein
MDATATTPSLARSALAGAAAATVWGLQEPLDRRLFRSNYSDVALLGKLVTRGRAWPAVGLALHATNGAVFGVALAAGARATRIPARRLAVPAALAEHVVLYPLSILSDRYHPARGDANVPAIATSPRAYAQETWRHLLFGVVLARLLPRELSRP